MFVPTFPVSYLLVIYYDIRAKHSAHPAHLPSDLSKILRLLTTWADWALDFPLLYMKSFLALSRTFFVLSSSSGQFHLFTLLKNCNWLQSNWLWLLSSDPQNIIFKSPTLWTIVIGKLERRLIRTSLITWPCMTLTFRRFVTLGHASMEWLSTLSATRHKQHMFFSLIIASL